MAVLERDLTLQGFKKKRKKLNGPSQKQHGGKNRFAIFHLQYEGRTAFHLSLAMVNCRDPSIGRSFVCVCVCACVHADGGGTDDVQCFRPFTDQM